MFSQRHLVNRVYQSDYLAKSPGNDNVVHPPRKTQMHLQLTDRHVPQGFALVVTLVLMVLLSILGLGLLSLSSIAVRSTARETASQTARANARLGLMLALGTLQREMGPDRRVCHPASVSDSAKPGRRHWIASSDSWNSTSAAPRPDAKDTFRRWLVSGPDAFTTDQSSPQNPPSSGDALFFLGIDPSDRVTAPKILLRSGSYAWWIDDENAKALVSRAPEDGIAATAWSHAQAAPTTGFPLHDDFSALDPRDPSLEKLPTLMSLDPALGKSGIAGKNFHDFTVFASGLFTDVARGGLKKDLSLFLDFPKQSAPLPVKLPNLNTVYPGGITWEELWLYHNVWQALQPPLSGLSSVTGGNLSGAEMLVTAPGKGVASVDAFRRDPFSLYKRPNHIRMQWISSLWAKKNPGTSPSDPETYQLCWVSDPAITLWNPFDVPVALHPDAYYSLKFWTIPYTVSIYRDGMLALRKTFNELSVNDPFDHIFSLVVGTAKSPFHGRTGTPDPVILMPGEVQIMSEGVSGEPIEYVKNNNAAKSIGTRAGWNLGRGRYVKLPGLDKVRPDERLEIEILPNSSPIREFPVYGSQLVNFPWSYGRDQRKGDAAPILGFQELWGTKVYAPPGKNAAQYPDVFPQVPRRKLPSARNFTGTDKELVMSFSLQNKTEESPTSWTRFHSLATSGQYLELGDPRNPVTHPLEVDVKPLSGLTHPSMPQSGPSHPSRGLFGGSYYNQATGQDIVIMRSIPREPPLSLGAFQHAIANGNTTRMEGGGALSPAPDPRALPEPEVSKPISNSHALPMIAPDKTSNPPKDGKLAEIDHSYEVNRMLWDSWFLSSIVQRQAPHHSVKKTASEVFSDFSENPTESPLPNPHVRLATTGPAAARDLLFSSGKAKPDAHLRAASLLRFDGAFNVNSTYVEAWKAMLASMNEAAIPLASSPDKPGDITPFETVGIPVTALLTPHGGSFEKAAISSAADRTQWRGFRQLTPGEIAELAEAMVAQVRLRGPFLSMADFINRRVGGDKDLALSGPLQAALDKTVNKELFSAAQRIASAPAGAAFPFPEAAELPKTFGGPAHVTQADILTAIGSQLTVRADTFRVRAFGEASDKAGNVTARAWCEAIVVREPDYIDPSLPAYEIPATGSPNESFGRRFTVHSFRWIAPAELSL